MKYSQIKIPTRRAITLIFDHISPYIFLSTFNLWYQQAKKQAIFMLYSRGIFDIKTLQCNWQDRLGIIQLRNKLIDLLLLNLAKKNEDGRKLKVDSIIIKSIYGYMVLD